MADFTYTFEAAQFPGFAAGLNRSDGAYVPCDLENADYQAFLAEIAAGMAAPTGWTGPTNPPPQTTP